MKVEQTIEEQTAERTYIIVVMDDTYDPYYINVSFKEANGDASVPASGSLSNIYVTAVLKRSVDGTDKYLSER